MKPAKPDATYPELPGFKNRETSISAARSLDSEAKTFREECVKVLSAAGPMSADQVADRLQKSVLTIRPRMSELAVLKRIEDTGVRAKNLSGRRAIVWKLC